MKDRKVNLCMSCINQLSDTMYVKEIVLSTKEASERKKSKCDVCGASLYTTPCIIGDKRKEA